MARPEYKFRLLALIGIAIWLLSSAVIARASAPSFSMNGIDPIREIGTQTSASGPTQTLGSQSSSAAATSTTPDADRVARARSKRAARRAAREKALAAGSPAAPAATSQAAPIPSQQRRDAQILAEQKAQSAETARENDALTRKLVHDQNRQQDEQRIQDAPGLGAQPLPGEPAIQPARTGDAPRIQDAPGPAQTLPKPLPDSSSAPQQ